MEEFLDNPIEMAKNMPIEKLEEVIKILKEAYYNDQSLVSDDTFDKLEDILREKNPKADVLKAVGAPVEFDPKKTKLPYWMGSLDKIKPDSGSLENWLNKFKPPYVISHKLDGISALLIINKTGKNKLYTRGDGSNGLDISHLIPFLGLDIKIEKDSRNESSQKDKKMEMDSQSESSQKDKKMDSLAIRGEIIMSKENWQKYSATNSNSRNMVSGLVNAKHPDVEIFDDVDFVAYEIIEPSEIEPNKQFKKLQKWGFKVAESLQVDEIDQEKLLAFLEAEKLTGRYQIDGIIVTQDQKYQRNISGNPKYSVAFKSNDVATGQATTVRQVIWSPTRHGCLKPRIEVEPIQVGDPSSGTVTIRFCTAFNAKYIKQHNIGPGSIVEIVRSGDVIPYITRVVLGTGAQMPKGEGLDWNWNESEIDIFVVDPSQYVEVTIENLTYFFKTMGAKYVSGSTIAKLVEAGWTTVSAILVAPLEEIATLPGLGIKSAERIRESLDNLLVNVEPARLMAASGAFGHGLGVKKLKLVLDHYPDCLDWECGWKAPNGFVTPDEILIEQSRFRELVSKIVKIPGYQTKTAHKFVYNLPAFQEFLTTLPEYSFEDGTEEDEKGDDEKGDDQGELVSQWNGQKVVFSGFRNDALEKVITSNGGTVTTTVTGKTTLVLVKEYDSTSTKVKKAQALGVSVKTLDEVI